MNHDVLAVGLRDTFLKALTEAAQGQEFNIIPAPTLEAAARLLMQRSFSFTLMDLGCFHVSPLSLIHDIRERSLCTIVLGTAGEKYLYPVESVVEHFCSYRTAPQELVRYIAALIPFYESWQGQSSGAEPDKEQRNSQHGAV